MLLTSLGHIGLVLVVVSIALFGPLILQLRYARYQSREMHEAALRLLYLHQTYWIPVLLTLLAITLHSVRTGHKIAGPLHRFREVFDAMRAGVLPRPVRLRKTDYLRPEMDAINAMLDAWRGRIEQAQRDSAALHESLARYGALLSTAHPDPAADARWKDILRAEEHLRATVTQVICEPDADGNRSTAPVAGS
jgi:hypothetical protein